MPSTDSPASLPAPRDADAAYSGIIDMILTRQLRLGERTSVVQLAERLGLGRTPVKEAITKLEAEGVLSIEERSGTTVKSITPEAAANVFAMRRNLESFSVEAAVRNVTPDDIKQLKVLVAEMTQAVSGSGRPSVVDTTTFVKSNVKFHACLVAAAHNEILDRLYAQIQLQAQIVTYLFHAGSSPHALKPRQNQHMAILKALEARDAPLLQRLLTEHAQETEDSVQRALAEAPGFGGAVRLGK
jgi:DNA-binding GntR family transcriptional regulator